MALYNGIPQINISICIVFKNVKVAFIKHVTVTYCMLRFQIVTFINVELTFLKYVTVAQYRNVETNIDRCY